MSKQTTEINYAGVIFVVTGIFTERVWTSREEEGTSPTFDIEHIRVSDSNIDLSEALPDAMIEEMQCIAIPIIEEQLNDY